MSLLSSRPGLVIVAASRLSGDCMMKTTITLGAFFGLLLAAPIADAAQFYKWTDEQGVTHYSADPPPKSAGNASEVKVRTKLPSGSAAAAENLQKQRDEEKKSAEKAAKKDGKADKAAAKTPERHAEKCKQLQTSRQTLEDYARVKETDANGEVRVLSPEEKEERVDEVQRQIKAFCE